MSPPLDAIGDFRLQTGAVGAQYNGGQTAIANFSIRSGTNDLHGGLLYYTQNEALNAAKLDDTTQGLKKAKNRNHDRGAYIGGPVIIPKLYNGKNKTFFFFDYEKDAVNDLLFNGFTTLAPSEYLTGDFSKLLNPAWTGNAQSGPDVMIPDSLIPRTDTGPTADSRTLGIGPVSHTKRRCPALNQWRTNCGRRYISA